MYNLLNVSLSDLWRTARSAKIDIRMMRRIRQRPLAEADPRAQTHIDPGRRLAVRIPYSEVADWIKMVGGAFVISICFLAGFIAADAWMSRQPISLQSICSNMLDLYKSRDEITVNEKWRQELSRLHDDCAVALHKYELTRVRTH